MDDSVSKQLRKLILDNGLPVLTDASHFETLLRERCPQNRKEIAALLGALREGAVGSLRETLEADGTPPSIAALANNLEENQGFAHEIAVWAIQAWSYALGVSLPPAESARAPEPTSAPQEPVNVQKIRPRQSKLPLRQKLMTVGAVTLAASGIVFWFFASSDSNTTAPKAETTADASIASPSATETPQPAVAPPASDPASTNAVPTPPAENPEVKADAKPDIKKEPPAEPRRDLVAKAPPMVHQPMEITIPRGTALSIRLGEDIDSSAASPGDRIKSSVVSSVLVGDSEAIPRGAHAVVEVASVKKAGRLRGSSEIKLQLVEVVIHGQTYPLTSQAYDLKAGSVGKIFEKGKGISISANETLAFSLEDPLKLSSR